MPDINDESTRNAMFHFFKGVCHPQDEDFNTFATKRGISLYQVCMNKKMFSGKKQLGLDSSTEVYAVLEDDGTEVDEEEYFQLLPDKSVLMVLLSEQIWSPNFSLQG